MIVLARKRLVWLLAGSAGAAWRCGDRRRLGPRLPRTPAVRALPPVRAWRRRISRPTSGRRWSRALGAALTEYRIRPDSATGALREFFDEVDARRDPGLSASSTPLHAHR